MSGTDDSRDARAHDARVLNGVGSAGGARRSPPSPEERVATHLRRSRGKSPRFLARRYRRSLVPYLHALEADPDAADLRHGKLDAPTLTALKIVSRCAAERARFARNKELQQLVGQRDLPMAQALVGGAVDDALDALAAIANGYEPEGLKATYHPEEEVPPYAVVLDALVGVSRRGKME